MNEAQDDLEFLNILLELKELLGDDFDIVAVPITEKEMLENMF